MSDPAALRDHYASLPDDVLRDIATTSELTSDARAVLDQELARRGIVDLAEYSAQMDADDAARSRETQERLEARALKWGWHLRVYAVLLFIVLAVEAVQFFAHGKADASLLDLSVAGVSLLAVGVGVRRVIRSARARRRNVGA